MCEQCSAGCKTYNKKIFDKYWLVVATRDGSIMEKGDYGLVVCNDPDFLFENVIELKDFHDDYDLGECIDWFEDNFQIYSDKTANISKMACWHEFYTAFRTQHPKKQDDYEYDYDITYHLLKEIHEAINSGFIPEDLENV